MTDEETMLEAKALMSWLETADRARLAPPAIVREAEALGQITDGEEYQRARFEVVQKLDKIGRALSAEHYPDSAEA